MSITQITLIATAIYLLGVAFYVVRGGMHKGLHGIYGFGFKSTVQMSLAWPLRPFYLFGKWYAKRYMKRAKKDGEK